VRFSGAGDQRGFVGDIAAEFVAEIAAHLCHRVGDAILVVLRGDPRQRIGLVAVALEIFLGDLAEDAGEAALDLVLFLAIGRARSSRSLISAPDASVIFSTPTTRTMRAFPAAIELSPIWIAAEPVAQAFSTRVAGLKRKAGSSWNTSEAGNSCFTKPPFIVPR